MSGGTLQCLLCNKKLIAKDLSNHLHTHIHYFPQKCNICDFQCTQQAELDVHKRETDHSGSESIDLYKQWLVDLLNDDIQFTTNNGLEELLKKKNIVSLLSPTPTQSSMSRSSPDIQYPTAVHPLRRFKELSREMLNKEMSAQSRVTISIEPSNSSPVISSIENRSNNQASLLATKKGEQIEVPSETITEDFLGDEMAFIDEDMSDNEMLEPAPYFIGEEMHKEDGMFSDIEEEDEDPREISIPPPASSCSSTFTCTDGIEEVMNEETEREEKSTEKSGDGVVTVVPSGNISRSRNNCETDGIVEPPLKKSKSSKADKNPRRSRKSTSSFTPRRESMRNAIKIAKMEASVPVEKNISSNPVEKKVEIACAIGVKPSALKIAKVEASTPMVNKELKIVSTPVVENKAVSAPVEKKPDISCVIGIKPPVYPPNALIRRRTMSAVGKKNTGSVSSSPTPAHAKSNLLTKTPLFIPRRESMRNAMKIAQMDTTKQLVRKSNSGESDDEEEEGSEESDEDDSEEEKVDDWLWLISCICGQTKDDGEPMVLCDRCQLRWEHVECIFPRTMKAPAGLYICHSCQPRPTELTPEQARAYQERVRAQKEKKKELKVKRKEAVKAKRKEEREKKGWTKVRRDSQTSVEQSTADESEGEEMEESMDDEKKQVELRQGGRNEERENREEETNEMPILTATRSTFRFTLEKDEEEPPVLTAIEYNVREDSL